LIPETDLVRSVMGGWVTVSDYITRWEQEIIPERNLAPSSVKQYGMHCKALQELFSLVLSDREVLERDGSRNGNTIKFDS
jgi:hypothetical protein